MKAFPAVHDKHLHQEGMDLRDYFAAKAMQSLLTHHELCMKDKVEIVAEVSYKIANAMMEARKQ